MKKIDRIINEVKEQSESMDFHEIIYEARERLGIRLYKVAEHSNIAMPRLKRLESGVFRVMPSQEELSGLSDFFGFEEDMLRAKASIYLEKFKRAPKAKEYFRGPS